MFFVIVRKPYHVSSKMSITQLDGAIRDQIIDKCRDPRLRRIFLEKTSSGALASLQETDKVHEAGNI